MEEKIFFAGIWIKLAKDVGCNPNQISCSGVSSKVRELTNSVTALN